MLGITFNDANDAIVLIVTVIECVRSSVICDPCITYTLNVVLWAVVAGFITSVMVIF